MAGQNAFAYDGEAFIPEDRDSTASLRVRAAGTTSLNGVLNVYKTSPSLSPVWSGTPPVVESFSAANSRTGTFPDLANNIVLSWTLPEVSLISGFDIFYDAGVGFTKINGSLVSKSSTSYEVGFKPAGTHRFYVKSVGVNGISSTTSISEVTVPSSGLVSVLSSSKTTGTATVSWTVTAGVFQRFHIYDNSTYLGEVLATGSGTSYSYTRTGLSQTTSYNFRVYAQNYDGIFGSFREANVTTNTLPIPSISWSDSSSTKYSDWSITWTAVNGVTYQPEYYVSSWANNGSTVTGTGSKTSPTQTVSYGQTLYMRLKVNDAYTTGYTSQIQVTAGRPLITETSWKTGSSTLYEYIVDANAPGWGNLNALTFSCTSTQDYYFDSCSLSAYSLQSPFKEITRTDRRARYQAYSGANTGTYRTQYFDGSTSPGSFSIGVNSEWHTSEGTGAVVYYFGVADEPYFYINGANRYANVSNGTIDNWNLGANSRFFIRVYATPRNYTTTTTQTQVNSTYA